MLDRPDTYILIGLAVWITACWAVDAITRARHRYHRMAEENRRLHRDNTRLMSALEQTGNRAATEIHLRQEVIDELDDRLRRKDMLLRQRWEAKKQYM
ncbi:MAG: hypothetical protein VB055_06270 [Oscillospiraceae bacterium]|nr:hypothetical protein [Oscillospiraceae bacterium]